MNDKFVYNDDCSRVGVFPRGDYVFIDAVDKNDYSACVAFSKIKIAQLIDILTEVKENMD